MKNKQLDMFLHILTSEKEILSRTDQKAYSLLSLLGLFLIFFIVYYRFLITNNAILILLPVYFIASFLSIWNIISTINPRIHKLPYQHPGKQDVEPTFFGGIKDFGSPEQYHNYLRELTEDEDKTLHLFSQQIHVFAQLNWVKNANLKRGINFFVISVAIELLMILSTFIYIALDKMA